MGSKSWFRHQPKRNAPHEAYQPSQSQTLNLLLVQVKVKVNVWQVPGVLQSLDATGCGGENVPYLSIDMRISDLGVAGWLEGDVGRR